MQYYAWQGLVQFLAQVKTAPLESLSTLLWLQCKVALCRLQDLRFVCPGGAIAQKVLPKIQGHGDDYEKWLEELRAILNSNDLNMSAKIVKDITERGVQQMKYFQFFA